MTADEARAKLATRLAEIEAEYRRRLEFLEAWRSEARASAEGQWEHRIALLEADR